MKWLEEFMNETVKLWTDKEFGDIPLVAGFVKTINENKQVISKIIGDKGEDYIVELTRKNGYISYKTIRSWSDADVFSFSSDLSGFNHLMLTQVKATEKKEEPEILSDDDIESLKNYSAFVLKRWFESNVVPKEFKGNDLILSCGYVGVVIKGEQKELFSPEAYQFFYHKSYKEIKQTITDKIIEAHDL
jgi:hypothetical protein